MKTLIKTLASEKGEIFTISSGRRVFLATCHPKIEIYEHSQKINVLGARSGKIKSHNAVLVICPEPDITREVNADFLQGVSHFELVTDIQRSDGIYERIIFDNLTPEEIDLQGDWTFEVVGSYDIVRKLLTL